MSVDRKTCRWTWKTSRLQSTQISPQENQVMRRLPIKLSPEFKWFKASVIDVGKFQLLELFTLSVVVNSRDTSCQLMEADVVESLEWSTIYLTNPMVGNKEVFLPAHENIFSFCKIFVNVIRLLGLLRDRPVCSKLCPVLKVSLFIRTPFSMTGLERVLRSNHFGLKVCGQCRVAISET